MLSIRMVNFFVISKSSPIFCEKLTDFLFVLIFDVVRPDCHRPMIRTPTAQMLVFGSMIEGENSPDESFLGPEPSAIQLHHTVDII